MLAADKLQLQSALKQQATALKEKEFNLHHSNLRTVGTQAAVLAGLDITMFIEFTPSANSEWGDLLVLARMIKFCYYITIVGAFSANMMVVSHTTALSVLGAGLALRGPDGSMMTATDGLYDERKSVFYVFGVGLVCTVSSVILCVWLILRWEAALVCMSVTVFTCHKIYSNYTRVVQKFYFNENETVDFTDIFEGPAAIQAVEVPKSNRGQRIHRRNDMDHGSSRGGTNTSSNGNRRFRRGELSSDDEVNRFVDRRARRRQRPASADGSSEDTDLLIV